MFSGLDKKKRDRCYKKGALVNFIAIRLGVAILRDI